jgi:ligand-binding sensor domain-containing protein
MPKLLIASLLLFSMWTSHSQEGDFPITHHKANIQGLDFTAYDLTFDQYGLMYVATSSGMLRYDGVYWDFIETPAATFSVYVGADNQTYLGAMGGFGKLELTDSGLEYLPLSPDTLQNDQFTAIVGTGDSLLFISDHHICAYQPKTGKTTYYQSPDRWPIEAVVQVNNDFYVTTRVATYFWSEKEFREADLFGDVLPIKVADKGGNRLVLSHDGDIYTTRQDRLKQVSTINFKVSDFKWVNDSIYVVSSRNDGSMLLNYSTGQIIGRVNYKTGLPDDEINAIEVDWNDGIWIAHQFGFSRVDPNSPIECLSNQEGLEGNLITSTVYKGNVFLGTSSGLFRPTLDSILAMNESARRLDKASVKVKSKKPILKEVRSVYRRIPGISNKVNSLTKHEGLLLVGTNEGLFSYDGKRLVKVMSDPVSKIASLPKSNQFLVVDDFKVSRFTYEDGEFTELPFGLEKEVVVSVFGDKKSLVWLVGTDYLKAAGLTFQGASVLSEVDFPNQFMETPTICELDKGLYFITSQGYFRYNYQQKTLTADSTMMGQLGVPVQHQRDAQGGFWMYDGKIWRHIEKDGDAYTYPYLSLFPDLRYIHHGGDGYVYFT